MNLDRPKSLAELSAKLRRCLRTDWPCRPFIADGSPFDCDIAIVGINPGTTTPFWEFWSDQTGFARHRWVSAYYAMPGARRNATRNRIERLVQALRPLRVVELNAYPYATRSEAELSADLKNPGVFHLMLRVAQPKVLFVFGRAPALEVAKLLSVPAIQPGSRTIFRHDDRQMVVIAEPHLSRGWSYAAVDELACRVRSELTGA